MKRMFGAALICAAGLICTLPATAFGAGFSTYVGCSPAASAVPSHVCQLGDEPGIFFESPEEDVEYEVCVTFPDAETLCTEEQFAEEGALYVNAIFSEIPGDHLATWYVEGIKIADWTFRLDAPAPPPVPTPAPVPPAVVIPLGPTPACLQATQRVKKLKAKLQAAHTAKAKESARKRLRKAKAKKNSAC